MRKLLMILIISFLFVGIVSADAFSSWSAYGDAWKATNDTYTLLMWNGTGSHSWLTTGNTTTADYLLVGGGGAGGSGVGGGTGTGGGGGGGILSGSTTILNGTVTIVIGAGGNSPPAGGIGGNGINSTFLGYTAVGGGGGAGGNAPYSANNSIASGGGASYSGTPGTGGTQGKAGGAGATSGTYGGGGGGGYSFVGNDGGTTAGGAGGNGTDSYIMITNTSYGGGGGGGSLAGTGGLGGYGGGGKGNTTAGYRGVNGTPGSGGGGGGSGTGTGTGGYGGSGVLIVSYYSAAPVVSINASFTQSVNPSVIGQSVNFNDTSTGTPVTWNWTLNGGGLTNSTQNASYTYSTNGVYNILLNVTNATGSWSNTSQTHTVVNASGFTPQDIWMEGQYLQTFRITDSSTGLPIPIVDLQDTAMQTFTTTNGTGYLTEAFGASIVTFVSEGYDSRAISYVFDSDAEWDVQLTASSPPVIPNTNIIWSPSSVAIQILDANYVPILGDPVYITAHSSSLPGGLSGAVEYFKSAYGVSDSVAQSMFTANTTYYGTTDDNGFISTQVVSIIQYQIVTHDTNGINVTTLMWPAGAYYQIVTPNATVAGIAAQGRAQASIYKNSTFNTTFWEPNSTYSCMGINVYDSTGMTTNVSAWWRLVDNGTVWWTNSTSIGGYGPVNSSKCVQHIPYQQWKWGGITD